MANMLNMAVATSRTGAKTSGTSTKTSAREAWNTRLRVRPAMARAPTVASATRERSEEVDLDQRDSARRRYWATWG